MAGVCYGRISGSWKSPNFNGGSVFIKTGGVWEDMSDPGRAVFVKKDGVWEQVFPSDTETWTASNRPTQVDTTVTGDPGIDPSYPASNILSANQEVRWDGGETGIGSLSDQVQMYNFGWSPTTTAGFGYGAVSRIEVVFEAYMVTARGVADTIDISPKLGNGESQTLTYVSTTYTFDYTVATWGGLSDTEAGNLHLSPSASNSIEMWVDHHNATTETTACEDVKARIKYWSN